LAKRVALVTGASKGLGRRILEDLTTEGYFVYGIARPSIEADYLRKRLREADSGEIIDCDLSKTSSIRESLHAIDKDVDTVVHNIGGTFGIREPLFNANDFRLVLDLNFHAAVEINSIILPQMKARSFGRVIHISSLASVENNGSVAYAAAKGLLNAYVRALGSALHQSGIVLTAILPGVMNKAEDEIRQNAGQKMTSLKSISDLVLFLASDRAGVLSGSIIMADDGQGKVLPDWTT
jgi:3-oxoacyl-[acyl-carrier protein] reductase